MGTFRLPYGKSHIVCEVPDEQIVDVLNSNIQHYVPEVQPWKRWPRGKRK